MKIELTQSEYAFLFNHLLNDYAELVRDNICDIENRHNDLWRLRKYGKSSGAT